MTNLSYSIKSYKTGLFFYTRMISLKTEMDLHFIANTTERSQTWYESYTCRRENQWPDSWRTACFVPILSDGTVSHTKWFNSSYFEFSQEYAECYSKGIITQFIIEELTTYSKKKMNAPSHTEMSKDFSLSRICLESPAQKPKQDQKNRSGTNKLDLRKLSRDTACAARHNKKKGWELDVPVSNMCYENWVMNLQAHE